MDPITTRSETSQIAGIILAAGGSTRLGQPKQLLNWNNKPLVAHGADTALAAGLNPVIVVMGHAAAQVQSALAGRAVHPVMNWRWQEGLSTSVRTGLMALSPDTKGVILMQCDQPLLGPDLLQQLMTRFRETGAPIVHPSVDGQQRTPVLFAASLFAELAAVTGDQGGRSLIRRYANKSATVAVQDPTRLADIDTPEDYQRLLEHQGQQPSKSLRDIHHLIIDMDGVLWRGEQPMPGLAQFFTFLRQQGIPFTLATNNASKRPQQYTDKLGRFGIDIPAECILTSALATAAYLAAREPRGTPIYPVGAEGLRDALTEQGFELTEEQARYVIVGWNPDVTWQEWATAALLIQQGARFIGTNPDVTFPSERGLVPGNGSQLAALQAATGIPPLIIGKPQPHLYQEALKRMQAQPASTAVIGDRLDTDIAGGISLDLFTILLLSGITIQADLDSSKLRPDRVYADIEALTNAWQTSLAP